MTEYSPLEYIAIDAANQFGHDKWTFEKRIKWFVGLKNPMKLVSKAKKPAQYMAAVLAYNDALRGIPSGHLVGLDMSASGITIMGVLVGCKTTCTNVGLISKYPKDFYTLCTKRMNCPLERSEVKKAIMTFYYGSKAKPREIFEGFGLLDLFYETQQVMAPGAYAVMGELLDSWQPDDYKHEAVEPDGFTMSVPVLVNKTSKIEVQELGGITFTQQYQTIEPQKKGLSIAANVVHSVDALICRELIGRCNYDIEKLKQVKYLLDKYRDSTNRVTTPLFEFLYQESGFLSIEAINAINIDTVQTYSSEYKQELSALIDDILTYRPFEILTIHDEFKCHPNHVNRMRKMFIHIMAELADSSLLQFIIQQITGDLNYKINKYTNDLGDAILKGNYGIN